VWLRWIRVERWDQGREGQCEERRGGRGVGGVRVQTRESRESESLGRDREGEGGRVRLRVGLVGFAGPPPLRVRVGLRGG
jgi:hypothetical protein